MMTSKLLLRTARAGAAAAIAAVLSAGPARADGETIAVFTKNQTNPFFEAIRAGARAAAESMGAKVIQYVPTKPDNISEQTSQVEDVIVRHPDAIVFDPVDFKAMLPAVDKINAAGIPLVNITDRLQQGKVVSFIGADDYNVALASAKSLFEAMGGKGNLVIIEGIKGSISSNTRGQGMKDALPLYPNIKLLASQPANMQRLQALQVMENLLQAYPQIDGVLAANDSMATGVVEALASAGRTALVTGINGSKEAAEAIKAGTMVSTGVADPFAQGCYGVIIALRFLRHEPTPPEVMLKPVVADKSDLKGIDVPLDKRSCPAL
jgi:ribose transport system substrate-binding protein